MFEDAYRYPGQWSYRLDEQVWKEFVKWCHRLATSAANGFITEWPGVELMTTERVLAKYPQRKTSGCGVNCSCEQAKR